MSKRKSRRRPTGTDIVKTQSNRAALRLPRGPNWIAEALEQRLLLSYTVSRSGIETTLSPSYDYAMANTDSNGSHGIARDANGDFVAVWDVGSEYGGAIYAAEYNSAAQMIGSPILISSPGHTYDSSACVAMDNSGDFAVAWESLDPATFKYTPMVRTFDSSGNVLATIALSASESLTAGMSVAMDPANGNVVVGYYDSGAQSYDGQIDVAQFTLAGVQVGQTESIQPSFNDVPQNQFSLAMDVSDNYTLAWVTDVYTGQGNTGYDPDTNVYVEKFYSDGTASGQLSVNSYGGTAAAPSVATDSAGDFVVSYTISPIPGTSQGTDIVGQRFGSGGSALGGNFIVNDSTETGANTLDSPVVNHRFGSDVAMDPAGDFVITWTGDDSSPGLVAQDGGDEELEGIFARVYTATGADATVQNVTPASTGSEEFLVNTQQLDRQRFSSVAMDPQGDFVIDYTSRYGVTPGSEGGAITAQLYRASGSTNVVTPVIDDISTADADPLNGATTQGTDPIDVTFSQYMDRTSTSNVSNWVLSGPVTQISSITAFGPAPQISFPSITLNFNSPLPAGHYSLTATSGILDQFGDPITPTSISFAVTPPTVSFSVNMQNAVLSSSGSVQIPVVVTRSGVLAYDSTVSYTTQNGTADPSDYQSQTGTIDFPSDTFDSTQSETIFITTNPISGTTTPGTFSVVISSPTNATINGDTDVVTLTIPPYSFGASQFNLPEQVAETGNTLQFPVVRSAADADSTGIADWQILDPNGLVAASGSVNFTRENRLQFINANVSGYVADGTDQNYTLEVWDDSDPNGIADASSSSVTFYSITDSPQVMFESTPAVQDQNGAAINVVLVGGGSSTQQYDFEFDTNWNGSAIQYQDYVPVSQLTDFLSTSAPMVAESVSTTNQGSPTDPTVGLDLFSSAAPVASNSGTLQIIEEPQIATMISQPTAVVHATYGGWVSVDALVAAADGSTVNEGSVRFTFSSPQLPYSPVAFVGINNGEAAATLGFGANLPAGTYTVTAHYTDSGGIFADDAVDDSSVTATISPAQLTVTATDATKMYGTANPTFSDSITGFVDGDDASVVSGAASLTTVATTSSGVGNYPITASLGSLSAANYTFTFAPGTLSVTPVQLTVTATDETKTYGSANPTLSDTITGFVNGDAASVLSGAANWTTTAMTSSGVGNYPIVPSLGSLSAANYTFTFVPGILSVTPAQLTVTANNASGVYGSPYPAFTYMISGFVNGDNMSAVMGVPALGTTATPSSGVGNYPIVPSLGGLRAANYTFALVNGQLTINPAPLVVTAYGNNKFSGTVATDAGNIAGVRNSDSVVATFASSGDVMSAKAGTYPIGYTLSGSGLANYYVANFNPANLVVIATVGPSRVTALAQIQSSKTFAVSVIGTPADVSYDIYVSINGWAFAYWTTVTASSPTASFTGSSNSTYSFHSIAHDSVGDPENKSATVIDASTYVPVLDPPSTQVTSATANSTGLITINFNGTDPDGVAITAFKVYMTVDGGSAQLLATVNAGSPVSGVYSGTTTYQAPADGVTHHYGFWTDGVDNSTPANVQPNPATPNVTLNYALSAATPLSVTSFTVQNGLAERSFINTLSVAFTLPVTGLNLSLGTGITLTQYANAVVTMQPGGTATPASLGAGTAVNLAGVGVTPNGSTLTLNFGQYGLGGANAVGTAGANSSTAADGFYALTFHNIDGKGYTHTLYFFRLLGDVNGGGIVNNADLLAVSNSLGQPGSNLNNDVDGNGAINTLDKTICGRELGRQLLNGLLQYTTML